MQTLTQPTLLLRPFAESGDKNSIPVTNTDVSNPQLADLTNGFPQITSQTPDNGGLPPERKDFNGLGFLTTSYDWFYQAGGTFTFNPTISTAIGGYPFGARLWYTDSNGFSCILRSTIQNNTNNFLNDPTVIGQPGDNKPWEIENFKGLRSPLNLFDFKWSDYELNDQSWLRADTFSWQDGTVYTNAYNHLVDDIDGKTATTETVSGTTVTYYLADDGHKIVDVANITAVETVYAATGVAWYYVLDTVNQQFKLPRTMYGFTGYRDTVGKYVPETLPNIRGGANVAQGVGYTYNASGAFYDSQDGNGGNWDSSATCRLSFDASRSSSTYQDSAPVQQRATQMYLYFYVGQFTQTATEQTAGLNASLFNGKADVDMSNVPSNIGSVAKSYFSGLCMPSGTYDDLTLGASGATYTAPANGYVVVSKRGGAADLYLNNWGGSDNAYMVEARSVSASQAVTIAFPVRKGEVFEIQYNLTGSTEIFRFIYAQGEV